jgi:cytochrome c-type biogenesis protein CcmF
LKKAFFWPTILGAVVMAGLLAAGIRHFYALMSFGLSAFVITTIVMEFWKGSRAIAAKSGQNLLMAAVELTHRNTRRYGGYIVHLAMVFMFIGFTGAAFNKDSTNEVRIGDSFTIGRYDLKVRDLLDGDNDNYSWRRAIIDVSVGGRQIATLNPEQRVYKASRQPTSEVSIRRRLNEDLYLNFAGVTNDGRNLAIIQSYVFPLVSWIWLGFVTLLFGTLVCLIPSKVKMQYVRTEVVGYAEKHATVTK